MSSNLPEPPSPAKFPYAGWVPTVNGRLSFRHIGESRNPKESRYANVATDNTRLVLTFQHRPLSDALFKWFVHPLHQLDGSFYFVLAARSDEVPGHTEEIHGSIFIYKSHADWTAAGRSAVRPHVNAINDLVNSFENDPEAEMEAEFGRSERELKQTSDIEIQYRLFRTGEVYFAKPAFKDAELKSESILYATAQGQDFEKWVADQCYFFLRDITHVHQHHSPSSDTVLMLHYRRGGKQDARGDVEWRRNVVYSLNHHIIRSKRFADTFSLFQAMGVVAYCKSFKGICAERFGDSIPGLPPFNDESLLASLKARADERMAVAMELTTNVQIRNARATGWRIIALTLAALITALVAVFAQPFIAENKQLEAVGHFLAANIFTISMMIFLVLLFVWSVTQSDWQVNRQIGRDILEFSNVRRIMFIGVYLLVAFLIVISTLYVSEPALNDMKKTILNLWGLIHWPH